MRSASTPSTPRPVSNRSIARLWPIRRGRLIVPRSTSGTPKRRQYTPSDASTAATRRSHHSASSRPPATAGPSIAAMTGFDSAAGSGPSDPDRRRDTGPPITVGERLEVGAGAEVATRTGEHGDGQRLVGVEVDERVEQRRGGDGVDGVAPFRAIDGDDANRPSSSSSTRTSRCGRLPERQPAGLSSEDSPTDRQPDCREYAAIDVPDVRQRGVLRLMQCVVCETVLAIEVGGDGSLTLADAAVVGSMPDARLVALQLAPDRRTRSAPAASSSTPASMPTTPCWFRSSPPSAGRWPSSACSASTGRRTRR